MAEESRGRITRYETVVATLIGVCAVLVSAYTAHVQRQQVRAAVWPILEYDTSNEPNIQFTLENKGVGPAIVRHVVVTVDGQPVPNWDAALEKLVGPEKHHYAESTMSGHVLAAGEKMSILVPHDTDNSPLTLQKGGPLWAKLNNDRGRVGVEICYCSTLGECWTLRRNGYHPSTTTETRTCPNQSAISFQQ